MAVAMDIMDIDDVDVNVNHSKPLCLGQKRCRFGCSNSLCSLSAFLRTLVLCLKALVLFLLTWIGTAAFQPSIKQQKSASSVIFPVSGNVYPKGYYHVTMSIGQPPKPYFLDIDTGSDLAWLQCNAPCSKCSPTPHELYKPNKTIITCQDPACVALHGQKKHKCKKANEQCDYDVEYADYGSSLGGLVKDTFSLRFTNGKTVAPQLAFGCGYDQEYKDTTNIPYADGVLGLGTGNSSILAQLQSMGLIRNVVGHCFSGQGGGFLFFGDDFLPKGHYSLGPANLLYGGEGTNIKGLPIVFDSGSTYTYFSSQAYNAIVSLIKGDLKGKQLKDAVEEKSLPVCWKGSKPFKSVHGAAGYFKTMALNITTKNSQLQLSPESYLVVTEHGNVCLGILNGEDAGLGNMNVIGDIFLLDKLVIYDNARQQVGWAPANCNELPKA